MESRVFKERDCATSSPHIQYGTSAWLVKVSALRRRRCVAAAISQPKAWRNRYPDEIL